MSRALLLFSALALLGCGSQKIAIMSWPEYSRVEPEWPYVATFQGGTGSLFYFGARHTFDPSDPQLARIEAEWERFRPDIAFTEGGSPPMQPSMDEAIRKSGEPGLVRFLAARDNVPTTTLDPSRAEEVAALSSVFSREQIKMFYVLRAISQYVQRGGTSAESEAKRVLGIYVDTPGLSNSPRDVAELEAAYSRLFPGKGRHQDVPTSWLDPVFHHTFLNDISRALSEYRDARIVELLARHVQEGQRVFAVIGGTHVVMQERALRARIRR